MSETRQDPERIYLEPPPYSPEGRQWCEDNVWPLDGDGPGGVEYIRADLHAAELEEAREEWRPIDTAPRDGTQVLLTGVGLDRWISTGRWVKGQWYDDDGPGWLANVTHWMPLPAPPREENDA